MISLRFPKVKDFHANHEVMSAFLSFRTNINFFINFFLLYNRYQSLYRSQAEYVNSLCARLNRDRNQSFPKQKRHAATGVQERPTLAIYVIFFLESLCPKTSICIFYQKIFAFSMSL